MAARATKRGRLLVRRPPPWRDGDVQVLCVFERRCRKGIHRGCLLRDEEGGGAHEDGDPKDCQEEIGGEGDPQGPALSVVMTYPPNVQVHLFLLAFMIEWRDELLPGG